MSAFEQQQEKPDKRYQYLLIAAYPYETVAFKIPNRPIDRGEDRFYTNWDSEKLTFTLQLFFEAKQDDDDGDKHHTHANGEENDSTVGKQPEPIDSNVKSNPFEGL